MIGLQIRPAVWPARLLLSKVTAQAGEVKPGIRGVPLAAPSGGALLAGAAALAGADAGAGALAAGAGVTTSSSFQFASASHFEWLSRAAASRCRAFSATGLRPSSAELR